MSMFRKKVKEVDQEKNRKDEYKVLHKKTIKELIAPAGIDASKLDHMEIISNVTRYARSFYVSGLPRSCTFPELFRRLAFADSTALSTARAALLGVFSRMTTASAT